MRKIKNNVFMVLALLPLVSYLFCVFRGGSVPEFVTTVQTAFGDFGAFFKPIITPLLTNYVALSDNAGVTFFCWLIGYYITLLLVYLVFSLFTFLNSKVVISGINKDELFINKHHKLDWSYTAERFGHTQITRIGKTTADRENVAKYCSKYITKGNIRISNHRYFCSKSLKKPKITREYNPALTVLVSDWLEDNLQEPYAHNRMCKAYSIPKRIYNDLVKYIEECKRKIAEKPWSFEEIDPWTVCPFDTWEQVTIC